VFASAVEALAWDTTGATLHEASSAPSEEEAP